MFIRQAKEILEAVPTAKFDEKSAVKLIRSIEEEEEQMLEPLLGEGLMQHLYLQYTALTGKYDSIAAAILKKENGAQAGMADLTYTDADGLSQTMDIACQQKTIALLRNIQGALVYRMLSNKLYSLSTSLNMGGGANRASAGDYEPADDKHLQEVRREYFMNSKRACDNILIMLERDAKLKEDSLWHELWKESDGYFLKEDLLFPTLRSLKPYYPCNEPTRFLSLAPVIRYCQDTYISPRVDGGYLDKLLGVDYTPTDKEKKGLKLLRTALAYYVRAKEGAREERNEALMTADSAMSSFTAWWEKEMAVAETAADDTQTAQAACDCPCCQSNQKDEEYDSFSLLFNPSLNRW